MKMPSIVLHEGNNALDVELTPIPSPKANLYVTVSDSATNQPLSGVKVSIGGLVAYTDSSGVCFFSGLNPGSYEITFQKEGYE